MPDAVLRRARRAAGVALGLGLALGLALGACGDGAAAPDAACRPSVLYLARGGGTYLPGPVDDAVADRSVIVEAPVTLAPWPASGPADEDWQELTACIRAALAGLPIEVTESDPSPAPHTELVFTTTYWDGPAGTTVAVPSGCRGGYQLGFVFGDALPTTIRACHVAMLGFAQLTARLALTDNCRDYLNLGMDCSPDRAFLDVDAACVDEANRPAPCRCTGEATQNSFRALLAAHPACPG